MIIQSVQQTYVFNQTQGAVTEPVNGNWLQAYCEYLGVTEPVNSSWLQALCVNFGITAPLYGSWTIALANYYGITQPLNGTWWYAISQDPGIPLVPCEWGANTNDFGEETRQFSSVTPCNILPDYFWDTTGLDWNLADISWAVDLTPPGSPIWTGQTYSAGQLTPTITGTAEFLSNITLVVDAQTYTGQTDSVGNWSVQITNPLAGGVAPTGTGYLVSVTATDAAGNISPATSNTIYIVEEPSTADLTVNMYDSYGDGWNDGWMELQYESSPGIWIPIEYNENPFKFGNASQLANFLANGATVGQQFYKTDNFSGTNNSGIYGLRFESYEPGVTGLNSGRPATTCENLRTLTVEGTGNFRTVCAAVGSYAGERSYDILLAGNIIATQTRAAGDWTVGNVQTTFTLT